MAHEPIRVIGVCGSLRPGSRTRQALEIALQGAKEIGAATALVNLREYELAFCDGSNTYPPNVIRLRKTVKQAHGIILGTPEYHGGMSGVLKNALDLMGFDEFEGKMVGLVGVSGGPLGAINALNSLRTIGRALHAWVIPQQALIPNSQQAFDPQVSPIDPNVTQRLVDVGQPVARFAFLHHSEQAREFMVLWENAPINPGVRETNPLPTRCNTHIIHFSA